MTKYGFIIDNRKCIGCNACTLACKQDRRWLEMAHPGPRENGLRQMFFVDGSGEV